MITDDHRVWKTDFNEGSYTRREWFDLSLKPFRRVVEDATRIRAWVYVNVVDIRSYYRWQFGNNGAQGWLHLESGLCVPDYCRQCGGCPEIWTRSKAKQLYMDADSPVLEYLVSF